MPRPRKTEPDIEWRRGKWGIVWYEDGLRRRISTKTVDEGSARQELADFIAAIDRRPLKLSVAEALSRYEIARTGHVVALDRLKEASKALARGLGFLRVDQIHQTAWDRYAAERVTAPNRRVKPEDHVPRPVSSGTLRREFNVLRAALRQAWNDGYLIKPPPLKAPADSARRERYLTKAEARAMIDAAETPHVKVFVALAIWTGARKGSILALTWERVYFSTGMIDFQEDGRELTKKRRSVVPMNASLLSIIQDAYAARQSDFVVEYAGAPVPSGLRWSFGRLCVKAGLTWKPTPHHMKHSVVSWLAMARVPIDQAADLVATDPATLRRVYRKFDPTYLRDTVAALEF